MNEEALTVDSQVRSNGAPLPPAYWGQCGRKIAHTDWGQAVSHAGKLAALNGREPNRKLRIYRCPWGTHWHVGNVIRPDKNKWILAESAHGVQVSLQNRISTLVKELAAMTSSRDTWRSLAEKLDKLKLKVIKEALPPQVIFKPAVYVDRYPRLNKVLTRFGVKLVLDEKPPVAQQKPLTNLLTTSS